MSFSIYKNPATLAKEARQARERKLQEEVEHHERMRQSIGQNSARSIRVQEVREIEQTRDEYQKQFQEYYGQMRETVLVSPDPDGFFDAGPALDTDPGVERDIHWNLFLKDHPDFYNSEENRNTLSQYFTVNQCHRYDRWVLSAAYKRLLSLGLLETAESQKPTVMIHEPEQVKVERPGEPLRFDDDGPVYPVQDYNFDSPFAKQDDRIQGRNPENGFPWVCTKRECDRMDADSFKRFASITKAAQTLTGMRSNYGDKYTR
jgi:hypothetical protein